MYKFIIGTPCSAASDERRNGELFRGLSFVRADDVTGHNAGVQPMSLEWDQIIHVYFPVTVAVSAQIAFLLLPINLRTWRTDLLNAWTYSGIQIFVAGLLFSVIPRFFGVFHLSDAASYIVVAGVFIASWWRIVKSIPLEATFPVTAQSVETPVVSFDSFYNPERLRQLGELSGDDAYTIQRQRALREMLARRRVDRNSEESEEG
jgi:hypothetical protein